MLSWTATAGHDSLKESRVSTERSRAQNLTMDVFAESLSRSPELFPLLLDLANDSVTLVRLQRPEYTAASFLDQRILTSRIPRRIVSWPEIARATAAAELVESCHYIFHIGHVGSTLLSRLLANDPRMFALREPAILRTLAQAASFSGVAAWTAQEAENRLSTCLKLWSRKFEARQKVCLKATSIVSEMAAALLSRPYGPRAILMYSAPEIYLAAILGAPHSPREAQLLAPDRLQRLERRLDAPLPPLSTMHQGEIVAMSWACEMTALMEAKYAGGDRAIAVDFDAFLAQPVSGLSRAFAHYGIAVSDAEIEAILRGPDMRRYSKAPEHAYDGNLRRAVLDEGRQTRRTDIRAGLAWLERMAAAFPAIGAVLGAPTLGVAG